MMKTKLFVGNLSSDTPAEDLRLLFDSAGRVVVVELIKDPATGKSKGFAFVEMVSQGDAGKAVSEFNDTLLDNHRIRVMPARIRKSSSKHVSGYVEYQSYRDIIHRH